MSDKQVFSDMNDLDMVRLLVSTAVQMRLERATANLRVRNARIAGQEGIMIFVPAHRYVEGTVIKVGANE